MSGGPVISPGEQAILDELRKRDGDIEMQLNALHTDMEEIKKGFPGGDPESHRRYHESVIEWRERRNRLVGGALDAAAKAGFVGGVGWILYAAYIAIKLEFGK